MSSKGVEASMMILFTTTNWVGVEGLACNVDLQNNDENPFLVRSMQREEVRVPASRVSRFRFSQEGAAVIGRQDENGNDEPFDGSVQ